MLPTSLKKTLRSGLPRPVVQWIDALRNPPPKRLANHGVYVGPVAGKKGLEIGGPSPLFSTVLPVYQSVRDLDGVNFSGTTVWEGDIRSGQSFSYLPGKKGFQFVSEASDLGPIGTGAYDFVLSSNCLEHVANPLKALREWHRVMKPGGALILVLPNKASNFDHKRPTTSFAHLLEDFHNNTTEHDLTHLEEIMALHDLSMDPPAGDLQSFRKRSLDNFSNRTLHHHVFDIAVMKDMLNHAGFEVLQSNETRIDFFALAISR